MKSNGTWVYEHLARPLLFLMEPEFVHHRMLSVGERLGRNPSLLRWIKKRYSREDDRLAAEVFGIRFRSPLGVAAGFDKGARLCRVLEALGFGHMEVGSVSIGRWGGNPEPRLFRLPRDYGLINRLGLNSEGAEVVLSRLKRNAAPFPIGLNLVKTADLSIEGDEALQDYLAVFRRCYDAGDFVTLNLSCPNTHEGKTFEDPEVLDKLLAGIQQAAEALSGSGIRRRPVLIKLSPDLDPGQLREVVQMCGRRSVDGYVLTNTTVRWDGLRTSPRTMGRIGWGGLSGKPLKPLTLRTIVELYRLTEGKVPLVACGGIGCDPEREPAEEIFDY
ncbi:MAG: quinone-dependent dihydroorotate dehydrogenase, partial [Acidobacteria bacterium]|nr:quinone-dependent dihydroorotate dehydrogenase [Acidobacteriota bacterium]